MRYALIVALLVASGCYMYTPYDSCQACRNHQVRGWYPVITPQQANQFHRPRTYAFRPPATANPRPAPAVRAAPKPRLRQKETVVVDVPPVASRREMEQRMVREMENYKNPLYFEDAMRQIHEERARRAKKAKEEALRRESILQ